MMLKEYAVKTHQGPYFQINEDTVHLDFANGLFLLLDGLGGSGVGDTAVLKIKTDISDFFLSVGGDQDSTFPFYYNYRYLLEGNALVNGIYFAHNNLWQLNTTRSISQRAASSIAALSESKNIVTMVTSGNVKVFLMRSQKMSFLMGKDTLSFLGNDEGGKEFRTLPTAGIGLFEKLEFDIHELKIIEGDQIILISDGCYGRLDQRELEFKLTEKRFSLSEKIDNIFSMSNQRGNLDNQSLMILQY